MQDKCTDNPRDCQLVPRLEALEETNKQHSDTHREIFRRVGLLETQTAVQENKLDTIMTKLDTIAEKLGALEAKPAKRWDSLSDKAVWAVCAAVIAFLLGRVGL